MKKLYSVAFLLLMALGASAQVGGSSFGANMFVTGQAGLSFYSTEDATYQGFAGGIGFGKWIVEPLALRINIDLATSQSPRILDEEERAKVLGNYTFATADFLWDFNATFSRIRNWRIHCYPMLGLGIVWRDSLNAISLRSGGVDHEVQFMFGAQANVRLAKGWLLYLESKMFLLPADFDGAGSHPMMNMTTLGITRNFFESPFHRRTEFESREVDQDWFFGIGIGPNVSTFDLMYLNPKYGMWGVAPEIMFGRNLTEFWTIRFQLNGISGHERYDTVEQHAGKSYTFANLHADLMVNLTHALNFRRGVRLNVLPYIGAGMVWRFDNIEFDMAADFGLFLRYYVNRRSDLYADLKYIMVPTPIGGGPGPSGKFYSVGLPSFTVGYIYNFGTSTTRYRQPLNWCPEP